jgi:hypothetical protein
MDDAAAEVKRQIEDIERFVSVCCLHRGSAGLSDKAYPWQR